MPFSPDKRFGSRGAQICGFLGVGCVKGRQSACAKRDFLGKSEFLQNMQFLGFAEEINGKATRTGNVTGKFIPVAEKYASGLAYFSGHGEPVKHINIISVLLFSLEICIS